MNPKHPFKWGHFQSDIILLCVRWYLRYPLSYRNLEEMMGERGLTVDRPYDGVSLDSSLRDTTRQAMQIILETKQ